MAPIHPLVEQFTSKLETIEELSSCSLLELDIHNLHECCSELSEIAGEMSSIAEIRQNYNMYEVRSISSHYIFRIYIAKFARLINTATPNWVEVIELLHEWNCSYSCQLESNAFFNIGTENQSIEFDKILCEDCSDELFESNLSGVDLHDMITSYYSARTLTDIDYMCDITDETTRIFIRNIYDPVQRYRNQLKSNEHHETFQMSY